MRLVTLFCLLLVGHFGENDSRKGSHAQKSHGSWSPSNSFTSKRAAAKEKAAGKGRKIASGKPKRGPRTFANNEAADSWGKRTYKDAKLSPRQVEAIDEYTQDSDYLNGWLRGREKATGEERRRLSEDVAELDAALRDNPLPETVVVKRGMGMRAFGGRSPGDVVGDTFEDPAYMSTALMTDTPSFLEGRKVLMNLTVPKGTPAYYANAAEESNAPIEQELILGRRQKFRVNAARYDEKDDQWIVDAEVIPP